jgi:hypothetical protein
MKSSFNIIIYHGLGANIVASSGIADRDDERDGDGEAMG